MSLSTGEMERYERVLKRSILRRQETVDHFNMLYELSTRVEKEPDILPLFRALHLNIEQILADFNGEQSSFMHTLIELGRSEEYTKVRAPIGKVIREKYYFTSAVADAINMDLKPAVSTPVKYNIYLPKIPFLEFNGNALGWPAFKNKFSALIDNNSSLSAIDKLHCLVGCTKGEASDVIKMIAMINTNDAISWQALLQRYDNPRLNAKVVLEQILGRPGMQQEPMPRLKLFLSVFEENVAIL